MAMTILKAMKETIPLGENGNDTLLGGNETDSANGGLGTDKCEAEKKTSCEK